MRKIKQSNSVVILAVIIFGELVVGIGSLLYTQKNDGPVEQAVEAVLRTQGIDVDLSPE